MKTQLTSFVNASVNNKFFRTAMVVVLLGGSASAQAQAVSVSNTVSNAPQLTNANVAIVESADNSLVFSVNVDNVSGQRFYLTIRGKNGTVLYKGNYTEKALYKKFVLPKGEDEKLNFELKGATGNLIEAFEVNAISRVVNSRSINRVI